VIFINSLTLLIRDNRSKEMRILIAAVLCAVICLTTITFAIDSIKQLLANTSSALVGGDRVISAPEPINEQIVKIARKNSTITTETITFYSMVSSADNLMLSSIKAVTKHYPLLGTLKISTSLDSQAMVTQQLPEPGNIWLESRALVQLGVAVGSDITVGNLTLKVSAVLRDEPDRIADGFAFAPRALINMQDVANTQAVLPGSRVTYKLLLNGTEPQLKVLDAELKKYLPVNYKLQSADNEQVSFKNLNLARNYLGLAIIVNVVLAAVAIVIAAKRYVDVRAIDAAILRCMGASTSDLVRIYVLSLGFMGLLLGVIGSLLGFGIQQIIAIWVQKYLNIQLAAPSWQPLLFGVLEALFLVLIVALPSVLSLAKVSPMQALRRENTLGQNNTWQIKINLSAKIPAFFRLSLNNIFYNFQYNILQVSAFALIICVALLLFIIRGDLLNNWLAQLPKETPNYFALNISNADKPKLQEILKTSQIKTTEFYPMARGTLVKINQEFVSSDGVEASGKRDGIRRPLNLTWTENLPVDNKILQGAWFEVKDHGKLLISIEKEIAERLGVKIGDSLTFIINTQEISAKISSIRSVDWSSFTPNFYVIYPPGLLDQAPHTFLASFYIPNNKAHLLRELVTAFPAINILSITEMLDQAKTIIGMLSLIVGFVWFFTLIIGFILLLAVVISSIKIRNYQNNIMRILGASKRQLQSMLALEYLILGGFSGLIGGSVAIATAKWVSRAFFQSTYAINWYILGLGFVAGSILMVCGGLFGTYRALGATPLQFSRNS